MSEGKPRPLLTFAVCTYNQESFVREAVGAAFAQTYSPLQILLSDDCSKDRTFEIIQEMASVYRGPHKISLNRNPTNFGLGKHVNRLVELTQGELLVVAAGDDVSLPERVEAVHQVWEGCGRKAMAIQCGVIDMDEQGCNLVAEKVSATTRSGGFSRQQPSLEDYAHTLRPGTLGCALAYDPKLFATFGPVPDALIHEDNVIALRALVSGPLVIMRDPLVRRRIHANNIYSRFHDVVATAESVARQEARTVRDAHNRVVMYDAFLTDLNTARAKELIGPEESRKLEKVCLRRRRVFDCQEKYLASPMWCRFGLLFSAWRSGADWDVIRWMVPRLAPVRVFNWIKVRANGVRTRLNSRFRPKPTKRWTIQGRVTGDDNSELQS